MFLLSFHSIKLKPILEHSLLLYIIGFHNSSFRAEQLGDSPNPSRRPLHTRPLPSSLRLALTFCVSCSTVGGRSLLLCWTQAFLLSEPFLTSPVLLCVGAWRLTPVLCASQAPGVWLALASRRHGGGWRAWEEGEPWAASLAGPWLQRPSKPQVPWLASLSLTQLHSSPITCVSHFLCGAHLGRSLIATPTATSPVTGTQPHTSLGLAFCSFLSAPLPTSVQTNSGLSFR